MELLHEQQLEIEKAYEHLADAREEVEELPHAFEKAKKNMAKRLQERMIKIGLNKKQVDTTRFNEFNIRDMIK